MSMADHIKPISYLKASATKIAQELKDDGEPYTITQNGEAAMVVQSAAEYEHKENTLAMLQMIMQAKQDISADRTLPIDEAFTAVRSKLGLG